MNNIMNPMKATFDQFLPTKKLPSKLIQASIDPRLYQIAHEMRVKRALSWTKLVEGLLKAWINSETK